MTRLEVAENFLHDAINNEMSLLSSEAVYSTRAIYSCLKQFLAASLKKLEHPSRFVLRAAAHCLGLKMTVMEPAFKFIREQYSPTRDGSQLKALMAWALFMKKAVSK